MKDSKNKFPKLTTSRMEKIDNSKVKTFHTDKLGNGIWTMLDGSVIKFWYGKE